MAKIEAKTLLKDTDPTLFIDLPESLLQIALEHLGTMSLYDISRDEGSLLALAMGVAVNDGYLVAETVARLIGSGK